MNRFIMKTLPLQGLLLIERLPIKDERGFFSRLFCFDELSSVGLSRPVVQINHSFTRHRGTVRGLHFQYPPYSENKMVSCIRGKIFDVAVDLRQNSPTFLQWHGVVLSDDNNLSLLVPEGFAHGFQSLDDNCEIIYFVTNYFTPESEGALNVVDPILSISWPIKITKISNRDRNNPILTPDFNGIKLSRLL